MTDNVFDPVDNGTPAPAAIDPTGQPAPAPVSKEEIAKLEKRLNDKDAFIETLKQERIQDRKLLETVTQKLEVFLQSGGRQDPDPEPQQRATPSISPEDLRKQGFVTIEDLQAAERKRAEDANLHSVLELGRQQYGTKLNEHVANRCREIGVDVEWARRQAASNPNVFIELFGIKKTAAKQPPAPTESDVSTAAFRDAPPPAKKSVMYGASTVDMLDAWKSAKPTNE